MTAYFTFTGGAWFERVSDNGVGFDGVSHGQLDIDVAMPASYYIFVVDGEVDIYATLPTRETTWGAVKALYR
jgi:hypothetical protein